jgi:hypothetical protein
MMSSESRFELFGIMLGRLNSSARLGYAGAMKAFSAQLQLG